jgi:hypothetical protein
MINESTGQVFHLSTHYAGAWGGVVVKVLRY